MRYGAECFRFVSREPRRVSGRVLPPGDLRPSAHWRNGAGFALEHSLQRMLLQRVPSMNNRKRNLIATLIFLAVLAGCDTTQELEPKQPATQTTPESTAADTTIADDIPLELDGTREPDFKPADAAAEQTKPAMDELEEKKMRLAAGKEREFFLNSIQTQIRFADQKLEKMNDRLTDLERQINVGTSVPDNAAKQAETKQEIRTLKKSVDDLQSTREDMDKAIEELKNADELEWEEYRSAVDQLLLKI